MSSGSGTYASRLKAYPAKGVCGLPETYDLPDALEKKLTTLSTWWKSATNIVVLTGAGISTSAGISDFRGPKGVWTLEIEREKTQKRKRKQQSRRKFGQKRRKVISNNDTSNTNTLFPTSATSSSSSVSGFEAAQPTLTHRALTALVNHSGAGKVNYIVTQNVDGLHQRAKLDRNKLAILHGCVFEEQCEDCKTYNFLNKEVNSISFQPTGNTCTKCNGICRDTLLDWEDALPEDQLCPSEIECKRADLVVTLGTSLRIEPAGSLPLLCKEKGGRFVIVNLQETPKDR